MNEPNWMERGLDPGPEPFPLPAPTERVHTGVRVVVRDGCELVGDLYVPAGTPPFPAVLERTPYGAQRCARTGRRYARLGYLFLALDVRGRYRSAGAFVPLESEADDGHDAIRWLASHALCNGRVGTRGESYGGTIQLLAASTRPPGLAAMVVGVAPGDPFDDVPFQGGACDVGDVNWVLSLAGRTDESDHLLPFEDEERDVEDDPEEDTDDDGPDPRAEIEEFADATSRRLTLDALRARPFRELDLRLGARSDVFRTWLDHWRADAFWERQSVLPRVASIDVPVLHVSGVWDGNGRGAVTFFRALRERAASPAAREHQRLLIGPWDHDLDEPPPGDLPEHAARDVARGALRDPMNDEVAWFERHLRGVELPAPARVTWFVTGADRWFELEEWPPPSQSAELHLAPTAGGSGALVTRVPGAETVATLHCDPDDPAPYGPDDVTDRGPFDLRRSPVADRSDVCDLRSAPLESPLLVMGDVRARVWWSSDAPDGDLYLQLADEHPDGRIVFLTDGILRARFRQGFDREVPVPPDEPVELDVDLWHLAHEFGAGHRVVLRAQSSALDRFDVNPCTGGSLADDTTARRAVQRLHGGPAHPSRLLLPVIGE